MQINMQEEIQAKIGDREQGKKAGTETSFGI